MIFLSLRFYVTSILGILEVQNLPFFTFRASEFCILCIFALFEGSNLPNVHNSEPQEVAKMAVLELLDSTKNYFT